MTLRFPSFGPVALLASSMMLAFSVNAASNDEGIVIYNAQHENLVKSWVDGFTKDTGIKVTLRNGGDSELGNQLVQEGNSSPADVFLTENSPAMVLVDNAKLFSPLDTATQAQVAKEYRPEHGRWTGIAARSTVFVYNPEKLAKPNYLNPLWIWQNLNGKAAGLPRPPVPTSRPLSVPCWN